MMYDNNLTFNDKNLKIYCEFKSSLRSALIETFPNSEIKGTYYNYIKRLWIKAKKLSLCHKNYIEYSHPVIFGLEIIPFLKSEDMNPFLNEIKQFIKELPEIYSAAFQKYIKYYDDIWAKTKFIHFDKISTSEWNSRGNNNCNAYHIKLSSSVKYFFPKMASLVKNAWIY